MRSICSFPRFDDDGKPLDQETCEKLFNCRGTVLDILDVPDGRAPAAGRQCRAARKGHDQQVAGTKQPLFHEAREQLEKWAEDMVVAAERELHDTKEQIKALNRQARQAATVDEQHRLQEQIQDMENKKRRQRQRIFDIEDEIMEKRDKLIDALERRMQQKTETEMLFTIRWTVT